MKIGDQLKINAYKHDGRIYRKWDNAIIIDIKEDYIVLGNDKAKVTERDGRTWRTKEPAVLFFFKNNWYNIIGQLKDKGLFYYCNIASPYIIDGDTLKYIDYDLDLRIFPTGETKVLDEMEYEFHKKEMNYSKDINKVVKYELKNLVDKANKKDYPFQNNIIEKYNQKYNDNIINKG